MGSSPANEVDTVKEVVLLVLEGDAWNVLVLWPFQTCQPLHIVTKLFKVSCKRCNLRSAGLTRRSGSARYNRIKRAQI
jgi:hypothetical protein